MKKSSLLGALQASLISIALVTASEAALIDRGGGLIYDTDLDVTWLWDANYAKTSGFDSNGLMSWYWALSYANNLSYYDSVRNVTYSDWRLPATIAPDAGCTNQTDFGDPIGVQSSGYNCTGSEMGHLFYSELGGVLAQSIDTTHNSNYDLFVNLGTNFFYWSATEAAADTSKAWKFSYGSGYQHYGVGTKTVANGYALAVRDGDVSAVPIPGAVWLFGSGLLGLIRIARCKKT